MTRRNWTIIIIVIIVVLILAYLLGLFGGNDDVVAPAPTTSAPTAPVTPAPSQ
jgi:hypothetical protein